MRATSIAQRLAWVAALYVTLAAPQQAGAQVLGRLLDTDIPFELNDPDRPTVLERPRPELAPLGISSGGFVLFPQVEVTPGYTSNVFGSNVDKRSDALLLVNPSISVRSRWSRNMLNAVAEGRFQRHLSNTIRDNDGYNAMVEGRIGIREGSNFYGQVRSERVYIEQYTGDFPANAASPVPLDRQSAIVRGTYQGGAFRLIGNMDVTRLDFSPTRTLDGVTLDQDFRDETVWRWSGRAEYRLSPARVVFAQATYMIHDYTSPSASQPDRTGDETRLVAGISFYPTPLLRTRLAVGYLSRRYDDPGVSDLGGLAVDLQADYLVSQLTTVSLAARRDVQDAILPDSPGFTATRVQARVDHEYLRNLLLHAQVAFEKDNFVDIDRRDTQFRLEAGASYTPFRRIVFDPTAQFIKRDSKGTVPGQRFDELRIMFRSTLRF
jgi:hypothetical protein